MYLSSKKCGSTKRLCLIKSIYRPGQKYPLKTVIKSFMPMAEIPEALGKIMSDKHDKARLADMLAGVDKADMDKVLQKVIERGSVSITDAEDIPKDSSGFNSWPRLFYGHLAAWPIWNKILRLKYKIDYLQDRNEEITAWRLNDLLFYLAASRMLSPSSYLEASSSRSDYFYCPWANISQDNFYRGLDFMYEHREEILAHAVRSRLEATNNAIKVAFFDCTNTWFETPYDDLTWQIIRFRRTVIERERKAGKTQEEAEEYTTTEAFEKELKMELELSEADIIRMRGPSKEGRYMQPLVGVALAIDQTGFPIDCKVFAGNLSELKMIEPMLQSLAEKYSCKDVYFTADRGLNPVDSVDKIKQAGLGFVVAQRVLRQNKKVEAQMLEPDGYRRCTFSGDGIVFSDEPADENCSRVKICDYERSSFVEKGDGSLTAKGHPRRHKVTIKCRIIFTYSPERYKRDMADLNCARAKALHAIEQGTLMGNMYGTGWRSLVKTAREQAEGKADRELYRAVGLKYDVIAEREKIAGYHAVIFDHPDSCSAENRLSDEQILATYHRLVRIEDCFRVMKSQLSIRPMYVRIKERIIAHCYICVLALMMLRHIQEQLEASGHNLSVCRIVRALSEASVLLCGPGTYEGTEYLNIRGRELMHAPQISGKNRAKQPVNGTEDQAQVWEEYQKLRTECADDMSLILKLVGLQPLKAKGTLADAKRRLHLNNVPNDKVIAHVKMKYMEMCSMQL